MVSNLNGRELDDVDGTDNGALQVLHLQAASQDWVNLEKVSGSLGAQNSLKCRWDPTSRYLVVLRMLHGSYDWGDATIFDALTSSEVHHCQIKTEAYWPQWRGDDRTVLPQNDQVQQGLALGLSLQLGDRPQQCFVHDSSGQSGRLTLAQGQPAWKMRGHRWSHMSPDGALVTTLLAATDGDSYGSERSAHSFRHYHTASAKEASMLLAKNNPIAPLCGWEMKPHPFLCAWLPGTAIYAAAALGFVYVVDGMHDKVLKMWPADAFELGKDDNPARPRFPRTAEPEFAALSWSPDGLHLAWVHDWKHLRIISFAASP